MATQSLIRSYRSVISVYEEIASGSLRLRSACTRSATQRAQCQREPSQRHGYFLDSLLTKNVPGHKDQARQSGHTIWCFTPLKCKRGFVFGNLAVVVTRSCTGKCTRYASRTVDPWLCVAAFRRVCYCHNVDKVQLVQRSECYHTPSKTCQVFCC